MSASVSLHELSGSAFDRGRAQGIAFKPAIAAHVEALLRAWVVQGVPDAGAHRARLLRETRFERAIEEQVPHLMREVEGIAAGSDLDPRAVYAIQLLDEEWAFRRRLQKAPPLQKCSSLALRDGRRGVTWLGQNMDLGAYTDGLQRLVHHAPVDGRPGALILTIAGVLALFGVNESGVGVCVNSIPQVPSSDEGLPVAFVVRRLLEASTAAEASYWCRTLPHATNQHYLIADAKRIVSLEASSSGVAEVPFDKPDRAFHTNHPVVNRPRYPEDEVNSVARLRSLENRLGAGAPTLEVIKAALSAFDDPAHPVCRLRGDETGSISFTTASMISALGAVDQPIESQVSFGPPSERGYAAFVLRPASK